MRATAFTDGRGNARRTGSCAAVLRFPDREVEQAKRLPGEPTNNEAEYEGVILACLTAIGMRVRELEIYSDSQLIVNQINGLWRIREPRLLPYRDRVWAICQSFDKVTINWIPREENEHADSLCRRVIKEPSPRRPRKHPLYKF